MFRNTFIAMLLLLCFGTTNAIPCSFACPELEYMRFYRPDLADLPGRSYWFYEWPESAPYDFFAEEASFFKQYGNEQKSNFDMWVAHIAEASGKKHAVIYEDVDAFIYEADADYLEKVEEAMQGGGDRKALNPGGFERYLLESRDTELIDYLLFMREAGAVLPVPVDSTSSYDDAWEYSAPEDAETLEMISRAEEGMKEASSEFLRLRYALLAMRLYRAKLDHQGCVDFFEKHVEPLNTASDVKNWCRAYYAGSFYWLKNYDKSFVEFSKVFSTCERYRREAFTSARWIMDKFDKEYDGEYDAQTIERVKAIATEVKTPEERNAVLMLGAYIAPKSELSIELIESMAKGDAYLPDMEVILGRAVNKLEMDLAPPFFAGVRERDEASKKLLEKLEKLCLTMQNDAPRNRALWATTAAYLAFLRHSPETALERAKAARELQPQGKIADQLRVVELLAFTRTSDLDEKAEARILEEVTWLQNHPDRAGAPGESEASPFKGDLEHPRWWFDRTILHYLSSILAPRYRELGRDEMEPLVLAWCARTLQNNYSSNYGYMGDDPTGALHDLAPDDIVKLRKIVASPATEFQKTLAVSASYSGWSDEALALAEGTQYLRLHNFTEAAKRLPEIVFNVDEDGQRYAFSEPSAWDRLPPEQPTDDDLPEILYQPVMLDETFVAFLKLHAAIPAPLHPLDKDAMITAKELQAQVKRLEELESWEYFTESASAKDYANQMAELARLGKEKGELGARALYIYGKGLYNMSYSGKGWGMVALSRSGNELPSWYREEDSALHNSPPVSVRDSLKRVTLTEYYWNTNARSVFVEAARKTADPELAARCLFMAALTLQNEYYCRYEYTDTVFYSRPSDDAPSQPNGKYFTENPHFAKIISDYRDTKFYKASFDSCSYLRDFAMQNEQGHR